MQTIEQQSHYRELASLGLPIIIGQLGTIVLGFADTLMIGHHSTQELAAAGLVNNVFALVLLFYLGFSYGLTPLVGRLYGREEHTAIGRMVKNSLAANLLVGLLLTALMTALYFNLHRIGQPQELLGIIRPYFLVNLVSIFFVGVFNTLKQFFDGITRTRTPMWVMIAGNVFNIFFNWMLIYGVGPFPEMGLLGAGLATLGSRVLMAGGLCCAALAGHDYREQRRGFAAGRVNRTDLGQLNRLGWPLALQLGMETAAFSLSSVMVGWISTTALAAHQVMITISQLFYMIYYGMAAAVSIRVSHFMGQHDMAAVRANTRDGFRLVTAIALGMTVPVGLLRHQLGGLFSDSAEVQAMVATVIIPLIIYQFGDGLQCTYANALRGISCVSPMVTIAFVAYFLVCLPLGYVLGIVCGFGLVGIWAAFPFGLTLAGILYRRRFFKELWKLEVSLGAGKDE